ncbi:MAG: 2-isopropylmalate synthase, partial [Brevibacterium aurantiacum]
MKLQKPTPMPFSKYKSFQDRIALDMRDRTWPDQLIRKAPRWLSTDLRDGNQALIDPMTPDRKRKMFDLLVKLGFKEIEVGFPAASQVDFDFVREIIEQDAIPDDVRISVLTQAREDLIERTVESLVGAKKPTVHLYNATAPVFRKVVFGFDGEGFDQTREIATRGTQAVMKHAESLLGDADFGYQYSPEIFVDTEPEFALDIVGSVLDMWQPATDRETVVNLPATVERGTPNTYADQIEWFCRNMPYRDEVAVSLHP